jgi:hypothetical protein
MSSRLVPGWATGLAFVLAFLAACGGAPKAPAGSATTPAAGSETPSQAANDPAAAPPADTAAPQADTFDPATAAGAVKGVPSPTNSASIEAVANFYTDLPGIDLSSFTTEQQKRFLLRVNSELCTCGCKNETLAFCMVNDPGCKNVKGLVQTVYDEIKNAR